MGEVIDRVPWRVVALFCLCVAASWHPAIRSARTGVREGIGVAAFFLVVGSMATDSPGLVTAAVLVMAAVTCWLIWTGREPRRGRHRSGPTS